ncbi:TPA: hypothetical protein N0F65_010516 [Lagenidium giganteum]|uniref:CST complex subunit CTC1 n=1 Tax=Lagenidium giganteum TaxID=4803 RepID=A0AAV2Z8P0_9STRA|nr:TPA: hypothetical protein N0F65_010516 [Lagenidium giganteum]
MELLEAMEELEAQAAVPQGSAAPMVDDVVVMQVKHTQQKLMAAHLQRSSGKDASSFPFFWVLSKLMKLYEEYPDGITDAIALTELMAAHYQRHNGRPLAGVAGHRGLQTEDDLLSEGFEDEAIYATIAHMDGHRLTLQLQTADSLDVWMTVNMYFHQRFRACMTCIQTMGSRQRRFPLTAQRQVIFTKAKVLERKDVSAHGQSTTVSLLPTPYMVLQLERGRAADEQFVAKAVSLAEIDRRAHPGNPHPLLQQSIVKARVVDIGAVRPCKTPLHIQRQVILLGEVTHEAARQTLRSSQRFIEGTHMLVLWDDQVVLSRLFNVGDDLIVFQPFVHMCEHNDDEIGSIVNEYSASQPHHRFYFEYGTATVLFTRNRHVTKATVTTGQATSLATDAHYSAIDRLPIEAIQSTWVNFAVYGQVDEIRVSHGIPLMAAYFYAYYDPTTGSSPASESSAIPQRSLDRAIVSKYYLVVLMRVYDAGSKRTLCVEITGENAVRALRLRRGQSVLLQGLVAVNLNDPAIASLRQDRIGQQQYAGTQGTAAFAFTNSDYSKQAPQPNGTSESHEIALMSDWVSIFGDQAAFQEARLSLINQTLGFLNSIRELPLMNHWCASALLNKRPVVSMLPIRMNITSLGWLIPSAGSDVFAIDSTCEQGFSTMLAHKPCLRPLEMAPRVHASDTDEPRWRCDFCHEIFTGMHETLQSFGDLVVAIEDGSTSELLAYCQGPMVESILGLAADEYVQLSLSDKRALLGRAIGRDFLFLLSRCDARSVVVQDNHAKQIRTAMSTRIDVVQQVDGYAQAQQLLRQLKHSRRSGDFE